MTLVQEYGKQLISGLMDMLIIAKRFDNELVRDLLLQCELIKRTTKTIQVTQYTSNYGSNPYRSIYIKNGRGMTLFSLTIYDNKIQEILEELRGGD